MTFNSNPALVEMWRNNLRKSRVVSAVAPITQQPTSSREFTINFVFDGAGSPITAGMAGLFEVNFPCRILACHIYAGNAFGQPVTASATIDLRLAQKHLWASGSSPIWTLAPPTLTTAAEVEIQVLDWIVDLEPGDILPYALLSVVAGTATWIVLTLSMTRLDVSGTSSATIVDSLDDTIVTANGDEVILRS